MPFQPDKNDSIRYLAGKFVDLPAEYRIESFLSGWNGIVVGTTCLLQVAVSLALDSRYDQGSMRGFFWMIWYPVAYWMLNWFTTIVAVPRALLRHATKRARWTSPERGASA